MKAMNAYLRLPRTDRYIVLGDMGEGTPRRERKGRRGVSEHKGLAEQVVITESQLGRSSAVYIVQAPN